MLASTVLASLNSARKKADNAARLLTVQEYKKALDFTYDADGQYPPPTGSGDGEFCLGDYSSNTCRIGNTFYDEDSTVSQAIARYLPSRPPLTQLVLSWGLQFDGPFYERRCTGFPSCIYFIEWYMYGSNTDCGFGTQPFNVTDPNIYETGYKFSLSEHVACFLRLK